MPTPDRRQADLLRAYWTAASRDPDAPPPDALDPDLGRLARELERHLRPPAPDDAFVAGLGQRLAWQAAGTHAHRGAPARRLPWPPRTGRHRLLMGLATAAVLVLLAGAVQLWAGRGQAVSAQDVIRRAEAAATEPRRFRTFVVTETAEVRAAATAGSDERVRSEISRWYEAPGRWRREVVSTVVGADGQALSRGGLTSVSDGTTVWIHRLRDNVVLARPAGSLAASDALGPFPEVTGGLSALLARAGACYTPRLLGGDAVAGRAAYVVELGRSRCTPAAAAGEPDAAGAEPVEWTIWVDRETFLILKSVQQMDGEVVATSTVTSVQYDVPVEPARFAFTAPPGAKIRDAAPPAPSGR